MPAGNHETETLEPKYWMGVVHRDHALRGVSQGIAQTNHGARFGVARMRPGDGFVVYSPKDVFPDGRSLREFTAIGIVTPGEVWQAEQLMGPGSDVRPWRRKVDWDEAATATPITPLLDVLELTRGIRNWGLQLQKGHLALSAHDFRIIAHEMGADDLLATHTGLKNATRHLISASASSRELRESWDAPAGSPS